MKKRYAVLANGWSTGLLSRVLEGIRERAFETNVDIYMFLNYAAFDQKPEFIAGEWNIFRLPELDRFDGIILIPGTFNSNDAIAEVIKRVRMSRTPAVSLEYDIEGIDSIASENRSGIYNLARHLIEEHGVRDAIYMGGPPDNRDNITRLKAVQDAFSDLNLSIDSDNILNGQFSHQPAFIELRHWFETHDYIPDAVICANDEMAMGCCTFLRSRQLVVPEDIIVTGYDHLPNGARFAPRLSTVDRNWEKMGATAVDHLNAKISGVKTQEKQIFVSTPVFEESCGCVNCMDNPERIEQIREISVKQYLDSINKMLAQQQIDDICDAVLDESDVNVLSGLVFGMLKGRNNNFGNVVKVFLNADYLDIKVPLTRTAGYSDNFVCVCDVNETTYKSCYEIKRKEIMANIDATPGSNHYFIFLPIHANGLGIGFIMLDNTLDRVYDYILFDVEHTVNRTVQVFKQAEKLLVSNKRLKTISVTDPLTGVYNRLAYEKYALPMLSGEDGKVHFVLMVDIDGMKTINDRYGHASGDTAVKLVADVLKEYLPKDFVIIRYGGDEFLVAGYVSEGDDIEHYTTEIRDRVAEGSQKEHLLFDVSISTGYSIFDKPENETRCLQEADDAMYRMKQEHHRKEK